MKIIEVRDGFIKFEADDSIYLSSFIQADGMDKSYVAQVNQIKKIGQVIIASAKILFLLVGEELHSYDKTQPSKDAELKVFPYRVLQDTIKTQAPVIIGKTLDNAENVVIDAQALNKKMLISADDIDLNNVIALNLSKQFENIGKKFIIIDTLGIINTKKFEAGIDFKLPLNTQTLDFMYKSCLNDATAQSKSTIAEIFNDLSEYSKTVPFVPFNALKGVVEDFVDKQHVFKLLVLKNKLAKFEKLGYFAAQQSDAENLDNILNLKFAVIDLSKVDTQFKNYFLEYIYSKLNPKDTQILVELSNSVSKKNLKNIISDSEVASLVAVHSGYQYLNDIKSMFDNFIIEPTLSNKEAFKVYSSFFGSMEKDQYLIIGEGINYIPVVSSKQVIEDVISCEEVSADDAVELSDQNVDVNTEEDLNEVDTEAVSEEIKEDISDEEEVLSDQNAQELQEEITEDLLTQEEIVNSIDEKSDAAIESVSENLEEIQEIDLFDDTDEYEDEEEDVVAVVDEVEEEIPQEEINDVIEPEYNEIEEFSNDKAEDVSEYSKMAEEEQEQAVSEEELTVESLEDEAVEAQELNGEDVGEEITIEESDTDNISLVEEEELQPVEDLNYVEDDTESFNGLEEDLSESGSEQEIVVEELESSADDDLVLQEEESTLTDNNDESEDLAIELDSSDEILLNEISESEEPSNIETEMPDINAVEMPVLQINDDDELNNLEELEELDLSEVQEDDIVVNIEGENDNITIDEDLDKQIVEDVDKVYTTIKNPDDVEEISDSDLDLIDELNSDDDEDSLEEYTEEIQEISDAGIDDGILDQPQESVIPQREGKSDEQEILEKRDSSTPIVPIYDAEIPQEDMVISDSIQQGDAVVHAKYGNGVVEKMIKYGTKTLYSINFENIGRRLLDPTLTEIKKL